jgi:hypothetical protein
MHNPRFITIKDPIAQWEKRFKFTPGTDEQFVMKEVLIDECYAFDFKKSDIVLNLGANIGAFDVYAFDRVKQIYAFEPCAASREKLERNLEDNGISNVYVSSIAVSNYDGTARFSSLDNKGHNGITEDGSGVDVNCVSLKSIF